MFKKPTKKYRRAIRQLFSRINKDRWGAGYTEDYLAKRVELLETIAAKSEGGKVAIVHGFMDCDGGRVDNLVTILPATVVAVEAFRNKSLEYAEGPVWMNLDKPSDTEEIETSRRDLAAEAHENGHPHVLHI